MSIKWKVLKSEILVEFKMIILDTGELRAWGIMESQGIYGMWFYLNQLFKEKNRLTKNLFVQFKKILLLNFRYIFVTGYKVKVKVKSLSHVRLFVTPWTVAYRAPLSMGFSRQECWSGLPFPSPIGCKVWCKKYWVLPYCVFLC